MAMSFLQNNLKLLNPSEEPDVCKSGLMGTRVNALLDLRNCVIAYQT